MADEIFEKYISRQWLQYAPCLTGSLQMTADDLLSGLAVCDVAYDNREDIYPTIITESAILSEEILQMADFTLEDNAGCFPLLGLHYVLTSDERALDVVFTGLTHESAFVRSVAMNTLNCVQHAIDFTDSKYIVIAESLIAEGSSLSEKAIFLLFNGEKNRYASQMSIESFKRIEGISESTLGYINDLKRTGGLMKTPFHDFRNSLFVKMIHG